MKKAYSKPTLYVEEIQLDLPIASTCSANKDDMKDLIELGVFTEDRNCWCPIEEDGSIPGFPNTTVCYHSNVQTAFLS